MKEVIDTRGKAVAAKMTIHELFDLKGKALDFFDRKGIRTACARYLRLDNDESPNTLYLFLKGKYPMPPLITPVMPEQLEKAKAAGWVIEIPVDGDRDFDFALIRGAEAVKAKLGAVTLADVTPIPYADKAEIRKLITRLKKSTTEAELKARGVELQDLIDQYEERENDTESDDLQEKFQSIREALESGQQELEKLDKESAIQEIEEALFY